MLSTQAIEAGRERRAGTRLTESLLVTVSDGILSSLNIITIWDNWAKNTVRGGGGKRGQSTPHTEPVLQTGQAQHTLGICHVIHWTLCSR